jgi:HAD superfamily hydrolase (TIGR01509 family)
MTGAVLWDLDGTLVDSEAYHWRSWRDTAAAEGIALTYPQFLESFGKKNDLILRGWLGPDASAERIQRVGDAKEIEYRRLARAEGLEPLPGAAEWVARLHAAGWKQAIASSAPRANVEVVMAALGFEPFIDAIVAAEDVTHSKPAPDVFLEAARRVDIPVARCIVVEDAASGIAGAKAAGMPSVWVSRHIRLTDADLVISTLAELSDDAFDRLLGSR